MINYTEGEIKSRLKKDGIVYILFDPVSYSDLGESKNFYFSINERKKILSDYKANRIYSNLYLETIELYRKYYIYRGDQIKLIYSDEHEADDYVEPLIKSFNGEKSVAIVTTDYDLAGYMSDKPKIHMINEGWDKPFTSADFEKLFQFKPTPGANILYKSLFGDKSDNIVGAIFMKKAKFNMNVKLLCRDYLKYVADNNLTIDEITKEFKTGNFQESTKRQTKTPFDALFLALSIVDLKVPIMEKLYTNIRVIRSSLTDKTIEPFIHCNAENATINDVIHKAIFGQPFSNTFGKVK